MKKEDMMFGLICPKCYQQDWLDWDQFEELVLNENPKRWLGANLVPRRMEGQYLCPYGCQVQTQLFAMGSREEVDKKGGELDKKYAE